MTQNISSLKIPILSLSLSLSLSLWLTIKMVVLKNYYTVRPAEPTPSSGICMSDCDQDKPITHAPLICFYGSLPGLSFASIIETLKISLSKALVCFYPLAGRLYWTTGNSGRVALNCNSMGARLYQADDPLDQLPLLLVQLTKFSCGGVSLGLATSHIMIDGLSLSHFISTWAKFARGEPLDVLPFLDRTLLLARDPPIPPQFNHDRFSPPPLLIGGSDNQEERSKETTVAMFHLSKTQVEKLKHMANVSRATNVQSYSRYEAVAGHLWRCTCNAREHKNNQITKLYFQVNFRNRMLPPFPQGYFGNAILRIAASSQSGELMTRPLGHASSKIREAVEMVTDDYVRSAIDLVKVQPDLTRFRTYHTVGSTQGHFYGNPNIEITSWIGLPLKNVDFGWGKEIYMGPATVAFDGKCFIFSGRDGDGSLTIAMRLQVAHMDAFKEFFYKDISDWSCSKL
ncbi:Spermidine hydroxycinnamoyl transferase [Camellia lanceoleosa]|uniref:Spermidine hydroxycinnamoyl transferase n=1 Tax=Camellia lanceoleosa TaxID=1840588 RepID=A0ACC0I734_9ERIC|nr:Spermidine hydroxycinnamoyl transferase [Camellia lanceoleosa]